ncbi:hypothetical protein ACWCPT_32280 [Streptomyces sp. NPDC002308]
MSTPAPAVGEPVSEALAEAAQTAAVSVRLLLTIADAVRRAARHRTGRPDDELGEEAAKLAPGWAADQLRTTVSDDVLTALTIAADWPLMARHLAALQTAGVDLAVLLPQLGTVAHSVHRAVTANTARIRSEGTDRWADLLRATLPEGVVRDAILASPAWPDMAAALGRLDTQGIDVTRVLRAAHAQGEGIDRTLATLLATPSPARTAPAAARSATATAPGPVPTARTAPAAGTAPAAPAAPAGVAVSGASRDARSMWGPLTTGLTVPHDLDLSDRAKALGQLDVRPAESSRFVTVLQDVLGSGKETSLLVSARPWPLLALRMKTLADGPEGEPGLRLRLAGLKDVLGRPGPSSQLAERLVAATLHTLTAPPGTPLPDRPRVSPAAARARSTTAAATGTGTGPAPAEPAVPAHRRPTAAPPPPHRRPTAPARPAAADPERTPRRVPEARPGSSPAAPLPARAAVTPGAPGHRRRQCPTAPPSGVPASRRPAQGGVTHDATLWLPSRGRAPTRAAGLRARTEGPQLPRADRIRLRRGQPASDRPRVSPAAARARSTTAAATGTAEPAVPARRPSRGRAGTPPQTRAQAGTACLSAASAERRPFSTARSCSQSISGWAGTTASMSAVV